MRVKDIVTGHQIDHDPKVTNLLITRYRHLDIHNLLTYVLRDLNHLNPRIALGDHSRRVALLTVPISERLSPNQPVTLALTFLGAVLHDTAKVGRPDLFNNSHVWHDGQETEAQKHAVNGALVLEELLPPPIATRVARMVLYHHFPHYPQRIRHNENPPEAQIIRLVDSFDAMTSRNFPTECLSLNEALAKIRDNRIGFSPSAVEAFLSIPIDHLGATVSANPAKIDCQYTKVATKIENQLAEMTTSHSL